MLALPSLNGLRDEEVAGVDMVMLDADVAGCVLDQLSWQMQRSGLLTAMLTRLGLAAELTRFVSEADVSPFVFLLTVNILLIIVGMFLDGVSMIVLLSPILFPLSNAVGINPIISRSS